VVITAMAMATRRLRFASGVCIAPLRRPVNLGAAASLSGGRVVAGPGSGWMAPPLFGLAKGPSLDDQLDAIRRTGEELGLSPPSD
jgi:alkanesulfonate monooxygenase SsuD/methylene tetrahydromethanopterin reductase-like flavin-dependent oxidoreductase (luciferase family)